MSNENDLTIDFQISVKDGLINISWPISKCIGSLRKPIWVFIPIVSKLVSEIIITVIN